MFWVAYLQAIISIARYSDKLGSLSHVGKHTKIEREWGRKNTKQRRKRIMIFDHLVWVWIVLNARYSALGFFWGSHGTIHKTTNSAKCVYPCIFGSQSTIHTFKNYFATGFSIISFQFLTISFQFLTNKRYLNRPLVNNLCTHWSENIIKGFHMIVIRAVTLLALSFYTLIFLIWVYDQ